MRAQLSKPPNRRKIAFAKSAVATGGYRIPGPGAATLQRQSARRVARYPTIDREARMKLTRQLKEQVKSHQALYRWALKAYSIKHPPPYRQPNMEFEYDAWMAISSLHYRGGRQIGEDNAGPYPYKEITRNQYETCRFADSRLGLQMNMTNMRLVMPFAKDAYQLTTALRNRYIAHRHLDGPRFNLVQSYLFSKFALSMPAYLTRRKERPVPDGQLQPLETAFYMLGTAPYMLVRQTMVRGDTTALDPQPLSGQRLYELSDASGVLVSTRDRACPASIKLICEFFDVIMNGSYAGALDSPEVRRVLDLLGDWDRFYAYAHAASRIELLIKLNQASTAHALLALHRSQALAGTAAEPLLRAVLDTALKRSYVNTSKGRDEAAILDSIRSVLVAVLQDHGDEATLNALKTIGSLEPAASEPAPGLAETARRIRQGTDVIFQACARDLQAVQQALGQSGWRSIREQDLWRRTGGPELPELLGRLGRLH